MRNGDGSKSTKIRRIKVQIRYGGIEKTIWKEIEWQ